MHEPAAMLSLGVNLAWYNKLSKSDQAVVENCATIENEVMFAEFQANNGIALNRLIKNHGVKLMQFNNRVYDAFGKAAEEVHKENEASSDIAKKTVQSFLKARREIGAWNKISTQAYLQQRNRVLGI
jgi:TRAP-type mannitol/chloroaromatic compound transport system substrate-binding protein